MHVGTAVPSFKHKDTSSYYHYVYDFFRKVAGVTRLELAASGVTGQRSNQLSYTPAIAVCRYVSAAADGDLKQTLGSVKRSRTLFFSFRLISVFNPMKRAYIRKG